MVSFDKSSSRPLIVVGMHRSGTSLTASLVESAGIDIGSELLGANESNPLGHYEDLAFQQFHARALIAQGLSSEGYTATARGAVPMTMEPAADELLAERMRPGAAWGWKDPRTTLFLDFWQERLPNARYLCVFRRPWEVVDSLFRRGDETFVVNPTFAFNVWTHYNRSMLGFVRRHPEQCAVVEISQLIADPEGVFSTLRSRLDVPLGIPSNRFQEGFFTRDIGLNRAAIAKSLAPEAWDTYLALRELAGTATEPAASAMQDVPAPACAALEWARASRAETLVRHAAKREAQVRVENETRVQAEVAARFHAELETRLQAELESRIQTELETRIQAELETRILHARIDRRRRSWWLPAALRRQRALRLLEGIAAAGPRPEPQPSTPEVPADLPRLRVFHGDEVRPLARAA